MRAKTDILNSNISSPTRKGGGAPDDGSSSLSETQHSAITCLLECPSIQEAAERCGVNLQTLQNWLQAPAFAKELNKMRRLHLNQVTTFLQSAANDAAATLIRLLKCGDPLLELRAAKIILQVTKESVATAETQQSAIDQEEAKTQQTEQIVKLEKENKSLLSYQDEVKTIVKELAHGTFRRPDWVTKRAWEQIIRADYSCAAST